MVEGREIVNNSKVFFNHLVEWGSEQPGPGEGVPDRGSGGDGMKWSLSPFQPKSF